ncbi:MAG: hypothetical protein ACREFX_13200, partial [Opitutaceae bacterium]
MSAIGATRILGSAGAPGRHRRLNLALELHDFGISQLGELRALCSGEAPPVLHAEPHEKRGTPVRHVDYFPDRIEGTIEYRDESELLFQV